MPEMVAYPTGSRPPRRAGEPTRITVNLRDDDGVLLNQATAAGIAAGDITVVLRRWDRPRAVAGRTQRTSAGTIRIERVDEHAGDYRVTTAQAHAAGFRDAEAARADLARRPAAHTYVITVSYVGPDERPELAAAQDLSDTDIEAISASLAGWDAASSDGPWTRAYLALIAANEAVRAPDLASQVRQETARFKRRVRQLKGLGLTTSLEVGYRIAPRGKAFLAATTPRTPMARSRSR